MNEILYDKLRTSMQQQKRKKQKVSYQTKTQLAMCKKLAMLILGKKSIKILYCR